MTWTFSTHAIDRALDMALDAKEIRALLENPEKTYPCSDKYPGCAMFTRGRLAAAVDPVTRVVITVLWNGYFDRDDLTLSRDGVM